MRALLVVVVLVGCGASRAERASASVDPQPCAADADCVVGTPRDCCRGYCPDERAAWNAGEWSAYEEQCHLVECVVEAPACPASVPPPVVAACVESRCTLAAPP